MILGDRYTGKTTIYLSLLLHCNYLSILGSIEGLGIKKIFGIYIGINQNSSKLTSLIASLLLINWFILICSSHSSSSSLLSSILPSIGIAIPERLRDKGYDIALRYDDFPKHAKPYRQIPLIPSKIPSRDASPSDISNLHSSILERCGKIKLCYFGGSITAYPTIETIPSDITEYIATNVIPITDSQLYTNKNLLLDSCRPSIDSSLSASRIGSNAQCKLMKKITIGLKNEPTNYRIMELSSNSFDFFKPHTLNVISFQDYFFIPSINFSIILIIVYRNGILFNNTIFIQKLLFIISIDYIYPYYIIFPCKSFFSLFIYSLVVLFNKLIC